MTTTWAQRDGTKIAIRDMTDTHLLNATRMVHRVARKQLLGIPCPNFQGEMAQLYAEQEMAALYEMDDWELAEELNVRGAKALHKELIRRNLFDAVEE